MTEGTELKDRGLYTRTVCLKIVGSCPTGCYSTCCSSNPTYEQTTTSCWVIKTLLDLCTCVYRVRCHTWPYTYGNSVVEVRILRSISHPNYAPPRSRLNEFCMHTRCFDSDTILICDQNFTEMDHHLAWRMRLASQLHCRSDAISSVLWIIERQNTDP